MTTFRLLIIICTSISLSIGSVEAKRYLDAAHLVDTKRELAKAIAMLSSQFELNKQVTAKNLTLSSQELKQLNSSLSPLLDRANRVVAEAKGYHFGQELIQLRLAKASMLDSLRSGMAPLISFEPKGSDKYWTEIEAFDQHGNSHYFDAKIAPREPVFVVELDSKVDLALGLAQMQAIFAQHSESKAIIQQEPLPAANLETTLIDRIRVNDVQESWISGNAEIYALVTGIEANQKDAKVTVVDLPYLNDDDRTYYPNQIIVMWNNYRYQAADIIFMEQDDNTNYRDIARRLLSIAEAYLNSVGKVDIGTIVGLTNQIIETLPDSWFTNDDDFVDVFYTIRKGRSYSGRYGAGYNVNMDLCPEIIPEN